MNNSVLKLIKQSDEYQIVKSFYKQVKQLRSIGKTSVSLDCFDLENVFSEIINKERAYISSLEESNFQGRFSLHSEESDIYSITYYLMTCGLIGVPIPENIKREFIKSFKLHQRKDGLFYDSRIVNETFINGDGWGARHLMPHITIAMERLSCKPYRELSYLDVYHDYDFTYRIVDSLNWFDAWKSSNFVMNIGVMLQYERDYLDNNEAQQGILAIQDWLLKNIRKDCGMWKRGSVSTRYSKYEMIRGAYHLYPILIYDGIDFPYKENAIDVILSLQNKYGGFDFRRNSSACEDIDAIEPLIRLSILTKGYRKKDVNTSLRKALVWCASNQMDDGGFVFRRGEAFDYGHSYMSSGINMSNMFATWFRTLCICYIFDYLTENNDRYVRIPGYEYPLWR